MLNVEINLYPLISVSQVQQWSFDFVPRRIFILRTLLWDMDTTLEIESRILSVGRYFYSDCQRGYDIVEKSSNIWDDISYWEVMLKYHRACTGPWNQIYDIILKYVSLVTWTPSQILPFWLLDHDGGYLAVT